MDLSSQHIERVLKRREAAKSPYFFERQAAVAMLLRYRESSPEVLLMRRIERSDDPWSGQVSFPGGSAKKTDADTLATAVRETSEEVNLDLEACAKLVGQLDPIHPVPRGVNLPLHITPVVFFQTRHDTPSAGDEAQRVFWFPLAQAAAGELDSTFTFSMGPIQRDFPCWRHDGEVVWGLTFEMLNRFFKLLRARD